MRQYRLGYPNQEVKQSLTDYILSFLTHSNVETENNKFALYKSLTANDPHTFRQVIQTFFSSIPHDWYRKNQMANYEGYYASIIYCYFAAIGIDVRPEETTNKGRIDLVIRFEGRIYILEFKVIEMTETGSALKQIKQKGYAEKFAGKDVYLVGVEFSSLERNITHFEWEPILSTPHWPFFLIKLILSLSTIRQQIAFSQISFVLRYQCIPPDCPIQLSVFQTLLFFLFCATRIGIVF